LKKVTNPHEFQITPSSDGASTSSSSRTFLGTSGQNVRDCLQITSSGVGIKGKTPEKKAKAVLDVMERFLEWGHMAPSAPDTLACYPFKDRDPFVITQVPDVFFAGCQSAFGSREIVVASQKSVLVSVPSFSETGSVVLLNLKTLKAEEVTFTAAGL
jgi:DNA polymerase delta subunit 2